MEDSNTKALELDLTAHQFIVLFNSVHEHHSRTEHMYAKGLAAEEHVEEAADLIDQFASAHDDFSDEIDTFMEDVAEQAGIELTGDYGEDTNRLLSAMSEMLKGE